MTAEQRSKLLQHFGIDEKGKLSFKKCEKIAKELNLTLEQVKICFVWGFILLKLSRSRPYLFGERII